MYLWQSYTFIYIFVWFLTYGKEAIDSFAWLCIIEGPKLPFQLLGILLYLVSSLGEPHNDEFLFNFRVSTLDSNVYLAQNTWGFKVIYPYGCWNWNSNTLAASCEELTHWKRPWCWEGLGAGGEGDDRGWDGWMASRTRWTWVWVISGSWWRTGRPGVLRFMGSQWVGHDWATELNWTDPYEVKDKLDL